MTELLAFNWGTVGSVLLAILILLAMITVHEFGHYIVGKLLNFRINEFSVGFGPALFKHKNKKTGELFSVRLIPLGGYCAFDGEDGIAAEEGNSEAPAEAPEEAFEEFRAPQTAAPEEEMKDGLSEAERLIQASSTTLQPKGEPFTKRPPWARILVLVAGAFMNYIFAVVLILIEFFACGQTLIAVYEVAPAEGEYAAYSLCDQDIILEADGRKSRAISCPSPSPASSSGRRALQSGGRRRKSPSCCARMFRMRRAPIPTFYGARSARRRTKRATS